MKSSKTKILILTIIILLPIALSQGGGGGGGGGGGHGGGGNRGSSNCKNYCGEDTTCLAQCIERGKIITIAVINCTVWPVFIIIASCLVYCKNPMCCTKWKCHKYQTLRK